MIDLKSLAKDICCLSSDNRTQPSKNAKMLARLLETLNNDDDTGADQADKFGNFLEILRGFSANDLDPINIASFIKSLTDYGRTDFGLINRIYQAIRVNRTIIGDRTSEVMKLMMRAAGKYRRLDKVRQFYEAGKEPAAPTFLNTAIMAFGKCGELKDVKAIYDQLHVAEMEDAHTYNNFIWALRCCVKVHGVACSTDELDGLFKSGKTAFERVRKTYPQLPRDVFIVMIRLAGACYQFEYVEWLYNLPVVRSHYWNNDRILHAVLEAAHNCGELEFGADLYESHKRRVAYLDFHVEAINVFSARSDFSTAWEIFNRIRLRNKSPKLYSAILQVIGEFRNKSAISKVLMLMPKSPWVSSYVRSALILSYGACYMLREAYQEFHREPDDYYSKITLMMASGMCQNYDSIREAFLMICLPISSTTQPLSVIIQQVKKTHPLSISPDTLQNLIDALVNCDLRSHDQDYTHRSLLEACGIFKGYTKGPKINANGYVDLHGLSPGEVFCFLHGLVMENRLIEKLSLKLITGKGLHSKKDLRLAHAIWLFMYFFFMETKITYHVKLANGCVEIMIVPIPQKSCWKLLAQSPAEEYGKEGASLDILGGGGSAVGGRVPSPGAVGGGQGFTLFADFPELPQKGQALFNGGGATVQSRLGDAGVGSNDGYVKVTREFLEEELDDDFSLYPVRREDTGPQQTVGVPIGSDTKAFPSLPARAQSSGGAGGSSMGSSGTAWGHGGTAVGRGRPTAPSRTARGSGGGAVDSRRPSREQGELSPLPATRKLPCGGRGRPTVRSRIAGGGGGDAADSIGCSDFDPGKEFPQLPTRIGDIPNGNEDARLRHG